MSGICEVRIVIVTGAGRGLGRAHALEFAHQGARVVVNDLDAGPAEEVVAQIRALGGEAVACVGSVTAADFADRFVKTAVDNYGAIDIIVNNAGYTWDNVIQKMSDEQWYAIIDCHITAPFRILRAAQPIISAMARMYQANSGMRCSAMPGARVRRIDTVSSTPAESAEISTKVMPSSQKSDPRPGENSPLLNGVYMNQPLSGAISSKRLAKRMIPPNR